MTEKPKAMVPKVRFRGFTDEWKQHKYGDEFERRMERNNGKYDVTRWISVAKMYFQSPDKVQTNHIDTRTYVMHKGDIAFEGHKNKQFTFGRFVENDIGNGVISELFPIYKHISPYDLNFWKYKIHIERLMYRILANAITFSGTSSNKLVEKDFLRQPVFVPNIDEQQKIGDLLKQLDATINLLQKKSDQLNTLKKALLQKMFADKEHRQPKLRFKGFSGDWELRELRELSDVRTGKAFKSSEFSDNGKYKVITNKEISDSQKRRNSKASRINIQNLSDLEKYKLDGQNILVTMDGVNIGKVKRYSNANAVLAQRVGRLNAKNIDFIFSIVDTSSFINKMQNLAVGNAIKHISLKQISGYTFKSPVSEDEQNKIGRLFIKLDKTVELHQHKLVQLQTLKKSLLQTMFV